MSRRLHTPKEVRFANPRLKRVGIELLHLAELKGRVGERHLATPERAEFIMLLLVTDGSLRHTVDFVDVHLASGSLIYVHPGQVQHWHLESPVQGCLVMIDPPALLDVVNRLDRRATLQAAMEDWPVHVNLDDAFADDIKLDLYRLARDIKDYDKTENDVILIRQVLFTLMLRIARWHRNRSDDVPQSEVSSLNVYRLFRRELEQKFREHWTISQYSQRLGFSKSTLNRACHAAAG